MALFKKEVCAHCGAECGLTMRRKLSDGKFICLDCASKCSTLFEEKFLSKHTYDEFCEYLKYKEENKKKLEQFVCSTSAFDSIHVDIEHGWIIFDKKYPYASNDELLQANPEVFEDKDLRYYDFYYDVKQVKEGLLSDKVKADVTLTVAYENKWYPYAFHGKVLKNHKHKAKIDYIKNKFDFTMDDISSELDLYFDAILIGNGISIPNQIGKKFSMKVDLEPYAPYFEKLFELKDVGLFIGFDINDRLNVITGNGVIKQQIKKRFGKGHSHE